MSITVTSFSFCIAQNTKATPTTIITEHRAITSKSLYGLSILRLGSDDVQTGISFESVSENENQPELYDLFGRKVTKAVPGKIYVKGGKKFLAK